MESIENKTKMFLMCGCSGAGKTTYAKRFAEDNGLQYIGIDDFYKLVNGDECIHKNKFNVWIKFWQALHDLERSATDCVVDTNALTRHQRKEFVEWFPTFEHHLIYVDANKDLREANNKKRKRKVPDNVMEEMGQRLEIPTLGTDPDFKTIAHVKNRNNLYTEVEIFERKY